MRNNNLGLWTEGMMSSLESLDTKKCCFKITHGLSYLFSPISISFGHSLYLLIISSHMGGGDGLDVVKMSKIVGEGGKIATKAWK